MRDRSVDLEGGGGERTEGLRGGYLSDHSIAKLARTATATHRGIDAGTERRRFGFACTRAARLCPSLALFSLSSPPLSLSFFLHFVLTLSLDRASRPRRRVPNRIMLVVK